MMWWLWKAAAGLCAAYTGCSLLCWWFPQLLHSREIAARRRRVSVVSGRGRRLMVCHRGGAREGRENTMGAFRAAVECGADGLELDVCLTRDGKVVVVHDPVLDRLAGQPVDVGHLDYADLPQLMDGHLLHFPEEVDDTYSQPEDKDVRIPLLEEVLLAFPDVMINIECKHYTQELVEELWVVIDRCGAKDRVVWGCARDSISDACYRRDPSMSVFAPVNMVFKILGGFLLGFLPFMPFHFDYFEVPFPTRGLVNNAIREMGREEYESSLWMRVKFWLIRRVLNSSWMYQHMRRRGIIVIPWVVNSKEEVDQCFKKGAHGVVTDRPLHLGQYIHEWDALHQGAEVNEAT